MNKMIFISDHLRDIEKARAFSKRNKYVFQHYPQAEWTKNTTKKGLAKQNIIAFPRLSSASASAPPPPLQTMEEVKKTAIQSALLNARGNASKAAKLLQISRATLYRKLQDLDINIENLRHDIAEMEYTKQKKAA